MRPFPKQYFCVYIFFLIFIFGSGSPLLRGLLSGCGAQALGHRAVQLWAWAQELQLPGSSAQAQ